MKKRIVSCVLLILLAIGASLLLLSCSNKGEKVSAIPKGVGQITSNSQESGGVTFTNYLVRITNDVDWDTLKKEEKDKIVQYVFGEVYKRNQENGIRYFNINGVNEAGVSVFQYDREHEEMIIKKNGQQDYRIPAPAK